MSLGVKFAMILLLCVLLGMSRAAHILHAAFQVRPEQRHRWSLGKMHV